MYIFNILARASTSMSKPLKIRQSYFRYLIKIFANYLDHWHMAACFILDPSNFVYKFPSNLELFPLLVVTHDPQGVIRFIHVISL